jgi:competence protein ComEC
MLAWFGGTALQLQQAALWPWQANAGLVVAAAAGVMLAVFRRHSRRGHLLLCAALVSAAFGSTAWRAEARLSERLAPSLEGRDLMVGGIVDRMPQVAPDRQRFVREVQAAWAEGREVALPPLLSLSWSRAGGDEGALAAPPIDLRAGQRWQLPVRSRRPHRP